MLGKLHYLGSDNKHIEIPGLLAITNNYEEIRNMTFEKNNLGSKLDSYGLELIYYSDMSKEESTEEK